MLAARLHSYTDEMGDALSLDEIDRPTIGASDDVVVEVEGAGWCQTDNHIIEGMWTAYVEQDLPMTLGHENAGTIVEVGEEVSLVEEGDRVICHPVQTCGICRPCRLGETMYCENQSFNGLTTDGGFAGELLTSERSVVPLPDGVDPVDIAPHADAGITAYHAAKKAVEGLNPGDFAVVIGVGGLGHIGLQCLNAMSAAEIVAVDVKQSARGLADDLGAHYTLNPERQDIPNELNNITDGTGAAQVLDFVGADETTSLAPEICAVGGDHHIIGYGGHIHEPAQALVDGEFAYQGNIVGRYTELQELVALIERDEVTLHTDRYELAEINDVAKKLERGEVDGRAVITP
ncbi:NAD(P)-dependent alcohol dehydrogenase [Natrinema soli]|uniref:NAD(P)-dependent alcohol dehydrogenase n=1 Tax=Natrinema soli TaxID=1930624 RepID=A0ABD5SJZ1_9EURY|nr:NAD(P)-dependent alcohol dehydrogenase [Natrinema soli]